MGIYEGMFMIDSKASKRDWEAQVDHVKEILRKHNARLIQQNRWDERKLAYEIRGNKRATYLLTYFEAPGDSVAKINREVELSDTLLRSLILKVKQVPEEKPVETAPQQALRRAEEPSSPEEEASLGEETEDSSTEEAGYLEEIPEEEGQDEISPKLEEE